ncbi:MAG: HAMP domain-containing histidine kinase [Candidatus Aminicenantes bacterium]|nr:HAMP domain-containing histidine kinase [Candidatus Aminicenantes bacterium]
MKRKDLLLFFLLPFIGILVIILFFSTLSRGYVQKKAEDLVREQLTATAEILGVNMAYFLEEGYSPQDILKLYEGEGNIYYLAILDENKAILAWSSRYEGYLPYSSEDAERTAPWTIASPVGRIFNRLSSFSGKDGTAYSLYLGYSLKNLEDMTARSGRNLLIIFAFLAAVGTVFFFGLYELQKSYLAKAKEAEDARREKERFREISAFTSAVAHEIKNPLNSLSLLCELLRKKVPADTEPEVMEGQSEVQKIARIIDRFSDALRPLRLNKEKVALREVVTEAWAALAREIHRPSITFGYAESRPVHLSADKTLLTQCLFNLLRNASEATEQGSVSVTAEMRRKKVTVKVIDSGEGVSPDRLPRLFDPFFTTKDKGMGIGLYLARKIVEAHGGRIEAESRVGQGTVFTLHFPGGYHE